MGNTRGTEIQASNTNDDGDWEFISAKDSETQTNNITTSDDGDCVLIRTQNTETQTSSTTNDGDRVVASTPATQASNDTIGYLVLFKSKELDEMTNKWVKQTRAENEKLTNAANDLIRKLFNNKNCVLTFCLSTSPTIIFDSKLSLKTLKKYEDILASIGLPVKKPTPGFSFFVTVGQRIGELTISTQLELRPIPKQKHKNIADATLKDMSDAELNDIKYIVNKLSAYLSQLEKQSRNARQHRF